MATHMSALFFRNDSAEFTASILEKLFEHRMRAWFRSIERGSFSREFLDKWIEKKEVPLIKGLMRTLNPEVFKVIQGMDEQEVWNKYWNLRKQSAITQIPIFKFLVDLNNNSL